MQISVYQILQILQNHEIQFLPLSAQRFSSLVPA
jgi:hypothetical protein